MTSQMTHEARARRDTKLAAERKRKAELQRLEELRKQANPET